MKKYILICLLCLAFLVACGTEDFESQSSDKNSSIASSVTPNVNTNTASPFLPYESYQLDLDAEKLLNDNPIDKAYLIEEKKQNAQTTYDELEFVGKYIDLWEVEMKAMHFGKVKLMEQNNSKEQPIRCPHCNLRLLDVEYVVGTMKCFRCKSIVKLKKVS